MARQNLESWLLWGNFVGRRTAPKLHIVRLNNIKKKGQLCK